MKRLMKLFAFVAAFAFAINATALNVSAATALLENTGFEDGLNKWAPFGKCEIEITTDEKFSGNNAVLVTQRGETGSGPGQDVTGKIQPGKVYKITAKVKYTEGPDTRDFFVSIRNGLDWTGITNMAPGKATKGEWGTIEGTYTLPEGADLQQSIVFVETSWTPEQDPVNDLMNYYVDDVVIEEVVEDATAAPKTGDASMALYYAAGAASFLFGSRILKKRNK